MSMNRQAGWYGFVCTQGADFWKTPRNWFPFWRAQAVFRPRHDPNPWIVIDLSWDWETGGPCAVIHYRTDAPIKVSACAKPAHDLLSLNGGNPHA